MLDESHHFRTKFVSQAALVRIVILWNFPQPKTERICIVSFPLLPLLGKVVNETVLKVSTLILCSKNQIEIALKFHSSTMHDTLILETKAPGKCHDLSSFFEHCRKVVSFFPITSIVNVL